MKKKKLTETEKKLCFAITMYFLLGGKISKREKPGVFLLFGQVETNGSLKPPSNTDLVAEHYIKLTVPWSKKNAGDKIQDAKLKQAKLTGNVDFVPPWSPEFTPLATLGTDITDADAKLLARSKNLPNSAPKLTTAVNLLYSDVKNIGTMIQLKMDKVVPVEAIRICLDAGYTYQAISVRGKRPNRIMKGTQPGQLKVWGENEGQHQWQLSIDGGTTQVNPPPDPTSGGILDMENLISDKKYWFRHRLVLTKGRKGEWSNWYSEAAP